LSSPQPTHATDWKCLFHVGTDCFLVLSATVQMQKSVILGTCTIARNYLNYK
jgi:hypothetical protein